MDNLKTFVYALPSNPFNKYKILNKLGEGGFGNVYLASLRNESSERFAIKTTKSAKSEAHISNSQCSEIWALKKLEGEENVIKLIELLKTPEQFIGIVLELCRCDLAKILCNKEIVISFAEVKNILQQFFTGLRAIHGKQIMHRDLKPMNVLVSAGGVIKISDLGSAIEIKKNTEYNPYVCTLWYRAPELLLGDRHYTNKMDIWSAGCFALELWKRTPLFVGAKSDKEQMENIANICGYYDATGSIWHKALLLPKYLEYYFDFFHYSESSLEIYLTKYITNDNGEGKDLLISMLQLNPERRIDAAAVLDNCFFRNSPCPAENLDNIMNQLSL